MKKLIIVLNIFLMLILLISCEKEITNPDSEEELVPFAIKMSAKGIPDEVALIAGVLQRDGYRTIKKDFVMLGDSAIADFGQVYSGSWHLTVTAFSSNDEPLYFGESDIEIEATKNNKVYLELNPVTGNLEVVVIFNTNPANGLLAYYPFNGNAEDESGNQHDGIVSGAILTEDRFGNENNAYFFDGIDDFIKLSNSENLKIQFPISICSWVKIYSHTGGAIFTNNYEEDCHSGIWLNFTTTGYPAINFGNNGIGISENRKTFVGETYIDEGTWYHICGIIKNADEMMLYINGEMVGGYYEGSNNDLVYGENPAVIGKKDGRISGPPVFLHGSIDEIRVYNRVLSEQEIWRIYTAS